MNSDPEGQKSRSHWVENGSAAFIALSDWLSSCNFTGQRGARESRLALYAKLRSKPGNFKYQSINQSISLIATLRPESRIANDMQLKQVCAAEMAVRYAALKCKQNKRYHTSARLTLAYNRKRNFFYFGCALVRRF